MGESGGEIDEGGGSREAVRPAHGFKRGALLLIDEGPISCPVRKDTASIPTAKGSADCV